MSNRIRTLSLLLALVLPGPRASAAEEVPFESFVDRVDVDVVNVEVFVTDREGRRITDLTREDFAVFEDDQLVEITNFYAVARSPGAGDEPAAAAGAEVPPQDQQLHLAVFVDNYNLRPADRARVLEALPGFLEERLAEGARIMVVDHNGTLEVVQPFTDDLERITAGLAKLRRATTHLPEVDARRRAAIRRINQAMVDGDLLSSRSHLESYVQLVRSGVQRSAQALERVVRSLGALAGRKAILYLSDGLEAYPGRDLEERFFGLHAGAGESYRFERLSREANAHQVTFYTVDARGAIDTRLSAELGALDAGGAAGTVSEISRAFNLVEPLFAMSGSTGGATIVNTFNFAGTLSQVGEDFGSFYSLGYRPRGNGKGRYHRIEVKVRRPGLWLRYRTGYLDKPLAERVADRTLSSLLLDGARNPLGIALAFGEPERKGRDKFLLPILISIPFQGVTFLPRDAGMEGRLRLFVAVRDEQGRLSPVRELAYPLSVSRDELEKASEGDIGYQSTLEIRPGTQTVAVGVWDEISGADSFVHETVVVDREKGNTSGPPGRVRSASGASQRKDES
ncbi:MAG: VWA domain-containing protein [bacterium]|nr:VWA domain-containing protein [bacterium]